MAGRDTATIVSNWGLRLIEDLWLRFQVGRAPEVGLGRWRRADRNRGGVRIFGVSVHRDLELVAWLLAGWDHRGR